MVHALKEVWRALVPDGVLIDLRPYTANPPLEIVAGGQARLAGHFDNSADLADDLAADKAIEHLVREGWFIRERKGAFDFAWYGDTPDEMKAYADDRWGDKMRLSKAALSKARRLFAHSGEGARVRLRTRIIIARYQKGEVH